LEAESLFRAVWARGRRRFERLACAMQPFRTLFRRRAAAAEAPPAAAAARPAPVAAPPGRPSDDDDEAMLDAGSSHGGLHSGLERGDGDAAALAADVLPGKDAIGSALGGLGAPPLFPLLPHEELLTDEERAVSLQGFGGFGCAATAGVSPRAGFPACSSPHCGPAAAQVQALPPPRAPGGALLQGRGAWRRVARPRGVACDANAEPRGGGTPLTFPPARLLPAQAFWCRHCHNESKNGPENNGGDAKRCALPPVRAARFSAPDAHSCHPPTRPDAPSPAAGTSWTASA